MVREGARSRARGLNGIVGLGNRVDWSAFECAGSVGAWERGKLQYLTEGNKDNEGEEGKLPAKPFSGMGGAAEELSNVNGGEIIGVMRHHRYTRTRVSLRDVLQKGTKTTKRTKANCLQR